MTIIMRYLSEVVFGMKCFLALQIRRLVDIRRGNEQNSDSDWKGRGGKESVENPK